MYKLVQLRESSGRLSPKKIPNFLCCHAEEILGVGLTLIWAFVR